MRANLASLVIAAAVALHPCGSEASQLRYQGVLRGGLVAMGNTLGLSKAQDVNAPGVLDSIGAFVAAGTSLQDGTYPAGTTSSWTENQSDAVLALPPSAQVVYAELIWGGSYLYGGDDLTASLESGVKLSSGGATEMVDPSPDTAVTVAELSLGGFPLNYYWRSADVTSFVGEHGSGTYRVGGVPATQGSLVNSLNAAGWALAVVYADASAPMRSVSVAVGSGFIDEGGAHDFVFGGFCAPDAGAVLASAVAVAMEGDATKAGDQLLAGPGSSSLLPLEGPNNPATNFFASQINDAAGELDTSGTFGTSNHDATSMVNTIGGRQGWDVTSVPLLATQLTNSQQTLTVQAQSSGDGFAPLIMGLQVTVAAPLLTMTGAVEPATVVPGSTVTYTLTVDNVGGVMAAKDAVLTLPLPAGVDLEAFTIDGVPGDASGAPVGAAHLAAGVDVGSFALGANKTIVMVVRPSVAGTYHLVPGLTFGFVQCDGAPVTSGRAPWGANTGTATFTAALPNSPPVLTPVGERVVTEGRPLEFVIEGSDPDLDPLSYSATGLPPGAALDYTSGKFIWVPGYAQAGSYAVTFRVSDGSLEDAETIEITAQNPSGPIFSDGFSNTSYSRKNWTVVSGAWTWSSPAGALSAISLAAQNLARISRLDPVTLPLGAGVITARVTLTSQAGSAGPNGTLIFGYHSAARHRWVKVTPKAIQIGQTGILDGIAAGMKRQVAVSQPIGKAATFLVKVRPSGLVQVFKEGAATPALSFRFLAAGGASSVVRGGVGLGSLRARTVFDNVKVWEESALDR